MSIMLISVCRYLLLIMVQYIARYSKFAAVSMVCDIFLWLFGLTVYSEQGRVCNTFFIWFIIFSSMSVHFHVL